MAKSLVKSKKMGKPIWLKYTEQEIREIILSLAKKQPGLTAEKLGLILRDSYGIPKAKIYGLKISGVLKDSGIYKSPDILNLTRKVQILETHLARNKQDKKTKRALIITKAKLKKAQDYQIKREE